MKPALLLACCLVASSCAASARTSSSEGLDFLIGCWVQENGTLEVWSPDHGGVQFGYGVTVRDDKAGFFEELRIERHGDETIYVAAPNGRASVRFTQTMRQPNAATFENADHDFPQRIAYERKGDTLTATISTIDGATSHQFFMTPCQAP